MILAGLVSSEGMRLDKSGTPLPEDAPLEVAEAPRWVGRAGAKLAGALERFGVAPVGRDALDVGASTGGFTQALLEAGAARVAALDVGHGQMDWGLRNDSRVIVLDGVNARYLTPEVLPFRPSLAVIDVSFISLRLVMPAVVACVADGGDVVALVKPQFEVGRGNVGRGGIVRDPALHREVLEGLVALARERGWGCWDVARSTIRGARGNVEFFLALRPGGAPIEGPGAARAIEAALLPIERERA